MLYLQVVVAIANILNAANLYGYIKCRAGAGKSLREYATGVMSAQMFSTVSDLSVTLIRSCTVFVTCFLR